MQLVIRRCKMQGFILIDYYDNTAQPLGWVSDPAGYQADLIVNKTGSTTGEYLDVPRINGNLYQITGSIEFLLG